MKALAFALTILACLAGCAPPSPPGTDKLLVSFAFHSPPASGLIDQETRRVCLSVPSGTDLSALVAVFAVTGTGVRVGDVLQESGITANDFSGPVAYVVTAEDGSSFTYAVSVTPANPPRGDKGMTSFALLAPATPGRIDQLSHAISLSVAHGTDLTGLVAAFQTTGVGVTVQDVPQESGVTPNDFTEPVEYVVTAEDGTAEAYTVSVSCLPSGEKAIRSFTFGSTDARTVIDQANLVIRVRVPDGTDLSRLAAVFESSGAAVMVAGATQASGVTVNDFSQPVPYTVRAEDGSDAVYTVRVTARIPLLINEMDVDQVGTDTAEFIELSATGDADMEGVLVILLNGGVTPGTEYARVDLSRLGVIPGGTYVVIAGSGVPVAAGGVRLTPTGWESSNRIQNGPNDAVMLWDAIGARVIDTVSYNGTLHRALISGDPTEWDATEGSAGAPADSNATPGSLGRIPNSEDTGQNGADFRFAPVMTPGAPNG